jgi:arylsulfatase
MYEPYIGKPGWLNFPAVTDLPDDAYCDNWVAANGMRCLKEFARDKPWHLVVNFVGPHGPFDVTADMRSRWKDVEISPPVDNEDPDTDTILARRQNYAAMIENIDKHVGRMIELVKQRGELDNTIIVYASDHGEMLGDHGRWAKSVWYTPSAGVPLIASGPGVQSGVCSDALVSLHDLAATFLDYAQADPLPDSDALSLRRVLEGLNEKHRDYVASGLNDWDMIFDGRYKCVTGFREFPMLVDVHEDPLELMDIADKHPHMVTQLVKKLEVERKKPEQESGHVRK